MPEGEKQVTTLRALLNRDFDRYKELLQSLDKAESRDFVRLTSTAFLEMADRKFGSGDVTAAVVEWVAKIRSESELAAKAFDPVLSEQVLLFVLGKSEGENLSARQIRDAELLLLPMLADDLNLDSAGIDELLRAARSLAEQ